MENTDSPGTSEMIFISEDKKTIKAKRAMIDNSTFEDISATGLKITDANLSDLEINGAQLGGAYIHNIGMPPKSHRAYDPAAKQRPLKFEDCDLNNSTVTNCNLSNVNINNCKLAGMKINGILVEELLKLYKNS